MSPAMAAKLVKGGRLEAKVINYSDSTFTVKISGKGHEAHDTEQTFPIAMWRGPGGVVGAPDMPQFEKPPAAGAFVYVDFDILDSLEPKPAKDAPKADATQALAAIESAKSAALDAISAAKAKAIEEVKAAKPAA